MRSRKKNRGREEITYLSLTKNPTLVGFFVYGAVVDFVMKMKKLLQQYKNDVSSIDSIVDALYDVISGDRGKARDWDRERNLFHPEARLIVVNKEDGHLETKVMTSDGFIQYARPFLDRVDFYEYEIFRKVEEFGHVAHIWSTYGSKRSKDDFEPYTRGINSIQLLNDQKRWWVISIYWNRETDEFQIPEKYLGNGDI